MINTDYKLSLAVETLRQIEEWKPPKLWDAKVGRWVSYSVLLGSNGERDFMRAKAADALKRILEPLGSGNV